MVALPARQKPPSSVRTDEYVCKPLDTPRSARLAVRGAIFWRVFGRWSEVDANSEPLLNRENTLPKVAASAHRLAVHFMRGRDFFLCSNVMGFADLSQFPMSIAARDAFQKRR